MSLSCRMVRDWVAADAALAAMNATATPAAHRASLLHATPINPSPAERPRLDHEKHEKTRTLLCHAGQASKRRRSGNSFAPAVK
jgi:hypothetical protein